ncbi:MAG: SCO family protein [Proteobacteria bacterium]|nr:SCO family protein [Pseudomonadota bacterium]
MNQKSSFMGRYIRMVFFSAVALGALSGVAFGNGKELPILYVVPNIELTDQNGKPFSSKDLAGKIWIVDFKFTICPDECPLMMTAMKRLQDKLSDAKGVEFLSITTDPMRDQPKVLKAFMAKFKASETNWHFLTGDKKSIVKICKEGFKFAAEESNPSHSQRFALVDRAGNIRAYYDSQSVADMKRLEADVRSL